MSLAILRYDHSLRGSERLDLLRQQLPQMLSEALSVPGTKAVLNPAEVDVWAGEFGRDDITGFDVTLTVIADDYPERQAILEEAINRLRDAVAGLLLTPGGKRREVSVWIMLVPAAFREFRISM